MALQPTGEYVLLAVDQPSPYHAYRGMTHVIVPEQYAHGPEDRMVQGRVLTKGTRCQRAEIPVGARVLVAKWKGAYLTAAQDQMIVAEYDIEAVVDES